MQHRWLAFLVLGFLTLTIFVLSWYRNKPIEITTAEETSTITSLSEPTVTFVNPSYGAEQPTVSIIVFSDFQCSACKTLASSLDVVAKTYPDDVKIIWKDLPNESTHPLSTPASIAAHCANEQGAFWPYHDLLFDRQTYLSESQFPLIAQELELDTDKFSSCFEARNTLPIVKKDYEEGIALGLSSTPTMYINDEVVIGAVTTQEILDLVDELLKK